MKALLALIFLLQMLQAMDLFGIGYPCTPGPMPVSPGIRWTIDDFYGCDMHHADLSSATEAELQLFQVKCSKLIGKVTIAGNPNLKSFYLTILNLTPAQRKPYWFIGVPQCSKQYIMATAIIKGNHNLREIRINPAISPNAIAVIGNPRIRESDVNFLKGAYPQGRGLFNMIQDYGECVFDQVTVKNTNDLNVCKSLMDIVVIAGSTYGTTTSASLTGFDVLLIRGSQLNNVKFVLSSTRKGKELTITDNKDLCLSLADEEKLYQLAYKVTISGNGNPNCDITCSIANIGTTDRCTRKTDDMTIDCKKHSSLIPAGFGSRLGLRHNPFADPNNLPVIGKNKLKTLEGKLILKRCKVEDISKYLNKAKIGNIESVTVVLDDPIGNINDINFNNGRPRRTELTKEFSALEAADMQRRNSPFILTNVKPPPKGVCVFPYETLEVKGCEKVEGDLSIYDVDLFARSGDDLYIPNKKPVVVEPILKEITGCLEIHSIQKSSYEFLTKIEKIGSKCRWGGGKSAITGVDCIPYSLRSRINLTELADLANHPTNYERCGLEHCVFASFAKEITNCTLIDGDLALDENSTAVEAPITMVTGCISIVNTRLNDYKFLNTIESFNENCTFTKNTGIEKTVIDNNTCISYTLRRSLKNPEIKKLVESGNNKKGCGECPGATVEKLKDGCKVILGDLKVDKLTNKSKGKMEKRLATVEEVYGQLLITDNNASTIEFKNLRIVETNGSGPAIQIVNNSGLVTIETPALESTITNNTNKVVITGNPKWNASATFLKKIKKVTGKDCGSDKKSGCYFAKVVQKPEKVEEKQDDKKEEEGGLGAGATAAIVVVVLIVVLALVAGGVVAAVLVVRKKKSSKKGEAGPAGKQPPGKSPGKAVNKQARKGASDGKGGKKTPMTPTTPRSVRTMESDTKLGMKSPSYEAITPTKSNEAITPATATKSNEAITPTASKEALTPIQKARTPATKTTSNEALTPIGSKEAINHKAGKPKVVIQPNKKNIAQPAKKGAALPGKKPVAAMPIKGKK